jgi:hypothetical protein
MILLQQTRTETEDKLAASRNKVEPATTPDVPIMNIAKVIDVNRFGSYNKLLRVTALVQKCARLWITKGKTTRGTLAYIARPPISLPLKKHGSKQCRGRPTAMRYPARKTRQRISAQAKAKV